MGNQTATASHTDSVPPKVVMYIADAGTRRVNCNRTQSVRIGVVGVELTNTTNMRHVEIYTLLGIACDTTMLNETVAKELDLRGDKFHLDIEGVSAMRSVYAQYMGIKIRGIHKSESYNLSPMAPLRSPPSQCM